MEAVAKVSRGEGSMNEFGERERKLLREISTVVDHMRDLRSVNAAAHRTQLKMLDAELGSRWDAVRRFRAPRLPEEVPARQAHYD